jgi:hypothetical protein
LHEEERRSTRSSEDAKCWIEFAEAHTFYDGRFARFFNFQVAETGETPVVQGLHFAAQVFFALASSR